MRKGKRIALLALAVVAISVAGATAAFAGDNDSGFKTSQPSMLSCPSCGRNIVPILTVGDTLPGGYRFEAIPDGISIRARGNGRADLFVNHETSTVAFQYVTAGPTAANSQNDFDNAQVSLLGLNQHSKGALFGSYAIGSDENYQRFCSNYLATEREGFDREIFFTNEEGQDYVNRTGTAWSQTIAAGTAGAEQIGVVVAYDPQNGKHKTIYGMGRHNHENNVAIPGFENLVMLSGDDTFFTTPQGAPYNQKAFSQLYSYIAPDTDAVWNDTGSLYAFVSDTAGFNDYFDFDPLAATPQSISGHFIKVPTDVVLADGHHGNVATGKKDNGAELRYSDFTGMLPPPTASGIPDGPQWVLDQWGNRSINGEGQVFRFVRIEDIAYDKRPGMSNVVYLADSGRATAGAAAKDRSTNGRIWKMVLNADDPTKVDSLSILVEGDNNPTAVTNPTLALGEIHQPDNVETTANGSLLVQEDPSGNNNYPPAGAPTTAARLWKVNLNATTPDQSKEAVASVDQSSDEGPTDADVSPTGALGSWESSGVVDASSIWGAGWFLVTVQAHTLWVDVAPGPDVVAPAGPDWTFKREGGQLLAIKIPGA
jgi:uncharacterized protein DUF839